MKNLRLDKKLVGFVQPEVFLYHADDYLYKWDILLT